MGKNEKPENTKDIWKYAKSEHFMTLRRFDNLDMAYFLGHEGRVIRCSNYHTLQLKLVTFAKRFSLFITKSKVSDCYYVTDESGKLILGKKHLIWEVF